MQCVIVMHLRQPRFIHSACGPFTKNKETIQKFKETEDSWYIHQKKLDKASFQHDIAYENFKDLTGRTSSDEILHDKPFTIAKNPEYDGYQRGFALKVYKFYDKKSTLLAWSKTLATPGESAFGGAIKKIIFQRKN